MPRYTLELSPVELDVIWRSQPFGDLPLIIDVPSPGATHTERAALEARTWTGLIERDLADDHGRASLSVTDALSVIHHRRRSLQLRTFGPDPLRVILAIRGSRAVLARLDPDRFRLAKVADTALTDTLLSLLPDIPAGSGHPISVSAAGFAEASRAVTATAVWDVLQRHGLTRDEARTLLDMTTGSMRTGQIAAELRTPDGHWARSARVVAFHDTPRGRYQTVRKSGYLTVAPATRATLAAGVNALTTELRAE